MLFWSASSHYSVMLFKKHLKLVLPRLLHRLHLFQWHFIHKNNTFNNNTISLPTDTFDLGVACYLFLKTTNTKTECCPDWLSYLLHIEDRLRNHSCVCDVMNVWGGRHRHCSHSLLLCTENLQPNPPITLPPSPTPPTRTPMHTTVSWASVAETCY